eukprot:COSAG04_NODE_2467_length_4076_cov_2.470958_5_plen_341_part_00
MSLGNFFVPWVVAHCSLEGTMTVGAALYLPFGLVFAVALATGDGRALFLPFAAALGCGASVFRTTQVVYVAERSRGYDAARRAPLSAAAAEALPSSLGLFNGLMSGSVSVITLTLDLLAAFAIQRGMSLATLFTACACATGVSVLLFAMLPSRRSIEAKHPLPRRETPGAAGASREKAAGDAGAVLRLICSSPDLQLLMLCSLCTGVNYSYPVGTLNADIVAPSLGIAFVGYSESVQQRRPGLGTATLTVDRSCCCEQPTLACSCAARPRPRSSAGCRTCTAGCPGTCWSRSLTLSRPPSLRSERKTHNYCWHLGCILPKVPAIIARTGARARPTPCLHG